MTGCSNVYFNCNWVTYATLGKQYNTLETQVDNLFIINFVRKEIHLSLLECDFTVIIYIEHLMKIYILNFCIFSFNKDIL